MNFAFLDGTISKDKDKYFANSKKYRWLSFNKCCHVIPVAEKASQSQNKRSTISLFYYDLFVESCFTLFFFFDTSFKPSSSIEVIFSMLRTEMSWNLIEIT